MSGVLRFRALEFIVAFSITLSACFGGGNRITSMAMAKEISSADELIGGPNATGQIGDFLLQNERIRVVIQRAGSGGRTPFAFGGNPIDLDRTRFPGEVGGDRFGGSTLLINGVRTVRAEKVFVLEDGSASGYAVIRAEGEDAPYQGTTLRQFTAGIDLEAAEESRARSLNLIVKTDYILRPGANFVEIRTTFLNRKTAATKIVVGDAVDKGSTTLFVSEGKGFSTPSSAESFAVPFKTLVLEAEGVSYGYSLGQIQLLETADGRSSARFAKKAALVPLGGLLATFFNYVDLAGAALKKTAGLVTVPGAGASSFSRYLLVGPGDSGSIFEGLNTVHNRDSEYLVGQVLTRAATAVEGKLISAPVPAVGADVAVFLGGKPFAHFKTDKNGQYRGALPPGKYQVGVNMAGHPYKAGKLELKSVTIGSKQDKARTVNFDVPAAAQLRLFMKDMTLRPDETGSLQPIESPLAGHVILRAADGDPSPDEYTSAKVKTWPFRPATNGLRTIDASGATTLDVEPADYEIMGYHGPAYSMAVAAVAWSGKDEPGTVLRADRVLEVARVLPAYGATAAQFSGKTDLARGALSPRDTIVEAMADGVQLLATADAGGRTDLTAALEALDAEYATSENKTPVSKQIGVVTGEQVATSGYGSFSAWPMPADPEQPLGGFLHWDNGEKAALPPAGIFGGLREDATAAKLKPVVSVDFPFAQTGASEFGYFDLLDVTVDWDAGTVGAGTGAMDPGLAGLEGTKADALWSADWTALNILPSADDTTARLGLNAYFALLNVGFNPDGENRGVPQLIAMGNPVNSAPSVASVRNLVYAGIDKISDFRDNPAESIAAVNVALVFRQSVVTNGPQIMFWVARADGSRQTYLGEMLNPSKQGTVQFGISVTAPCWAQVDRIDLYENSEVATPSIVGNQVLASPVPVSTFTSAVTTFVRTVRDGRTGNVDPAACRADGSGFGHVEVQVNSYLSVTRDTWFVAAASGSTPMTGLAERPIAITNPIFLDWDGGDLYEASCPGSACRNTGKTPLSWYTKARASGYLK